MDQRLRIKNDVIKTFLRRTGVEEILCMNCFLAVYLFAYHTARHRLSRKEENEKIPWAMGKAKQIVRFLIDPASHGVSVVTCLVGFSCSNSYVEIR